MGRKAAGCSVRPARLELRAAESGAPLEIVDIDVENVYRALGFITGDSVQSDVIDEVFSRFCLGK